MLQGDSESIKTQKAMLTQYAKEHDFMVVGTYVDDGFSGLNFDRPDFNRMQRLTEQMKRAQGITEQLKVENALEWVQRMNNIQVCAREIVEKEIVFT